jgi:ATP-binding cassette subfamily B (MDR/TAP) protein 1
MSTRVQDISQFLTVRARKTVAFVGGSGSDKSTAVALIEKFYDPLGRMNTQALQFEIGTFPNWISKSRSCTVCYIDQGEHLPMLTFSSLNYQMVMTHEQDFVFFSTSISRKRNLFEFPFVWGIQVGERGFQHITITGAMPKDPRLLLEEATSVPDTKSKVE